MGDIDERILKFISKHHVMTLATVNECGEPHCCSLFYVYLPDCNLFVFTTDKDTVHGRHLSCNSKVAANITLETKIVGMIEGLQIEGISEQVDEKLLPEIKKAYLKKYPFAVFMDIELWTLEPAFMKLTDNKMGFGKKLIWSSLRRNI